mmetsp:Transcript_104581/g.294703  ORF Transcript_104581/g.294703 Transcript_104581/m.294703 type:complete len:123 (+) Transcript_104581:867-1235(+)
MWTGRTIVAQGLSCGRRHLCRLLSAAASDATAAQATQRRRFDTRGCREAPDEAAGDASSNAVEDSNGASGIGAWSAAVWSLRLGTAAKGGGASSSSRPCSDASSSIRPCSVAAQHESGCDAA